MAAFETRLGWRIQISFSRHHCIPLHRILDGIDDRFSVPHDSLFGLNFPQNERSDDLINL